MAEDAAVGFSTHSGWAVMVAVAGSPKEPVIVARERIELVPSDLPRQPYHAADELVDATEQADLVEHVTRAAEAHAATALDAVATSVRDNGRRLAAVAVLGEPRPIPDDVTKVLASHALMHTAEGALYRDVIVEAAVEAGLPVQLVPPKQLDGVVEELLGWEPTEAASILAGLGKTVGSPWQKDHKHATLAALIALAAEGLSEKDV